MRPPQMGFMQGQAPNNYSQPA